MELDSFLATSGDFGKQLETAKQRAATPRQTMVTKARIVGSGRRGIDGPTHTTRAPPPPAGR